MNFLAVTLARLSHDVYAVSFTAPTNWKQLTLLSKVNSFQHLRECYFTTMEGQAESCTVNLDPVVLGKIGLSTCTCTST